MRKQFVVVVLVAAGWVACMTRTSGPQGSEPRAAEPGALATTETRQQTDGGCAVDACPDGGTGCLDLAIKLSDTGGRKFDPPPQGGWSMCTGQGLALDSTLSEELCVDLRYTDGTPVLQTSLGGMSGLTDSLDGGQYCLSVCKPKSNRPCDAGCAQSACSGPELPDTIRGNLDVISKDPGPIGK